MYNKETRDAFIWKCKLRSNGSDAYFCVIPSDVRHQARINFHVNSIDEEILMVRDTSSWNERNQGLVITDWGLYCIPDNDDSDSFFTIPWADVDKVFFKDECMHFYWGETDIPIHASYFVKDNYDSASSLARVFAKMADTQESVDANAIYNEYINSIQDGKFPIKELEAKGLDLIKSDILSEYGDSLILCKIARAWYLESLKIYNEESSYAELSYQDKESLWDEAANKMIAYADQSLNSVPKESLGSLVAEATYYKAYALHRRGNRLQAVRLAIDALGKVTDDSCSDWLKTLISGKHDNGKIVPTYNGYGIYGDSIEYWKKLHEEDRERDLLEAEKMSGKDKQDALEMIEMEHQEWLERFESGPEFFSHRPYQERQFIFVVKDLDSIGGCYDEADNIKYVFPIDELPGDITFPFGHPQPNTLYYAHPLRPYYLPAEGANLTLFYEKILEIGRMLQCLGATSITLRCLKGKQISEQVDQMLNADAEVGNWLVNAAGSIQNGMKRGFLQNSRNQMEETKHYNPTRFPYCPPDLLWAALDPQLNHLVKERLEGGLLNFSKKVSSLKTMNVTTNRMREIKGAFDHFMVKVSAHYNAQEDRTFSETEETEWEITAEFKPLNKFGNQAAKQHNVISTRTRHLLDKVVTKIVKTSERVAQLEASASKSQLTDDEQKYYNTAKEMLEDDGEITPRERRLLDRIREQSGISEVRAKELEAIIINMFER